MHGISETTTAQSCFFAQLFHYAAQYHSQERLNIKYLSTVINAVITFTKLKLFWTFLYTIPTSEVSGNTTISKTGVSLKKGVSAALLQAIYFYLHCTF